jgi:cytochrome c peroxidase
VAAATALLSPARAAVAADVDYKAVASDIMDLVKKDPDKGPSKCVSTFLCSCFRHKCGSHSKIRFFLALVRLAWHSSGTYDKNTGTGGSGGGTIRFKEELAHGGNAGLGDTAVKWLEPIYAKYDGLSYADLYTLSGVAAIKAMNGPTIGWSSGRVDQPVEAVTPDGRLPNADSGPALADKSDADHIRSIFNRMGFNDQEIVALSGAHTLGLCHTTAR